MTTRPLAALVAGFIAAGAATVAVDASAQAPTKAAAAAPAPAAAPITPVTPEQRAAIKELLDVTHARDNLGRAFQAMAQSVPVQMAGAANRQIEESPITQDQKQKVREGLNGTFPGVVKDADALITDPKNVDVALEKMIGIYARNFTVEEIRQIVAFYKTPVGVKTLTTMPQVVNETMQAGIATFQPKLAALLDKSVRAQIDAVAKK